MIIQTLKNYTLPLAMLTGIVFHGWLAQLSVIMPYMIFCMLLFTFSRVSIGEMKFTKLHFWLLAVQVVGCAVVYAVFGRFNTAMGEGLMVCVMAPTAVSASVITGMLGGSVTFLIGYVLVSNIGVCLMAPLMFSLAGNQDGIPFFDSAFDIFMQVMPILVLPLGCSLIIKWLLPKVNGLMVRFDKITFYLWAVSLTIVTGKTVDFIIGQENPDYAMEIAISLATMLLCCGQFLLGRKLGRRYLDPVSGGQGLGQKNTVLAIWMSHMYLSPAASIAPSSYILWQNIINSYQLWRKRRAEEKAA